MRRAFFWLLGIMVAVLASAAPSRAQAAPNQTAQNEVCPRPAIGSEVPEPLDLRSTDGILQVELTYRNYKDPATGRARYCYVFGNGELSPNLRLKPGDLLILDLKNELTDLGGTSATAAAMAMPMRADRKSTKAAATSDPCLGGAMSSTATNLHFHGLTIPPVCHQDDVVKTSIATGSAPFEYRFRIPADEQPGLYWYHPHMHGFSKVQVLGGASGALIIEGLERVNTAAAELPERVFVIRDEDLLNPKAPPSKTEPVIPKMMIDKDGDTANTGTGSGTPAKDLSINFVSVPYPDYPPAIIKMKLGQPQLWRVVNASAITYLNLQVLFDRKAANDGYRRARWRRRERRRHRPFLDRRAQSHGHPARRSRRIYRQAARLERAIRSLRLPHRKYWPRRRKRPEPRAGHDHRQRERS